MVQRNLQSLLKAIDLVEDDLDLVIKDVLTDIADELILRSPVDTGAYMLSHSIGKSSGLGGKLSSKDRTKTNYSSAAESARSKLYNSIATLPKGETKLFIGNRSPHASAVEDGGHNWKNTPPYKVYTETRRNIPQIIKNAVIKVRNT